MKITDIALTAKVQDVVNAMALDDILPVVDPRNGFFYILDADNKEFGTIQYTRFNVDTYLPVDGYQVKYSNKHTIVEVLFNPLPRSKHPPFMDEFPGQEPDDSCISSIIPGCY